jgi:hypothetical protein
MIYFIRPETIPEKMVYYPTVGTIVGAWAGAIVIPLDWDRPWQVIQTCIHNLSLKILYLDSWLLII